VLLECLAEDAPEKTESGKRKAALTRSEKFYPAVGFIRRASAAFRFPTSAFILDIADGQTLAEKVGP
jgi:hypothetical protein